MIASHQSRRKCILPTRIRNDERGTVGSRIAQYLQSRLGDRAFIVGQGSFPLNAKSEPQPDVAVLAPLPYGELGRSPTRDEFYALIEIAESSLPKDLGSKRRLYARSGIADYLVVDLEGDELYHFSRPHELGYRNEERLTAGTAFTLERLLGLELQADPFLGTIA